MTATPNSATPSPLPHKQVEAISHKIPWYRPTFSPEHGVYVILIVSFITGAAAAQGWTLATTLAFICAFAGFQAEHPLTLQIKQRHSWKPRLLVWGSLYAGVALLGHWGLSSPANTHAAVAIRGGDRRFSNGWCCCVLPQTKIDLE